jgi:eukaryotic-like serine/threonine-protein kinase
MLKGQVVGPYRIVDKVGEGGMGEVYRAHDARLGRDVAIKVLPAEFTAHPDRLRRFAQEARATAALNHPNVLAVFDVHTDDGAPYVVSELLEGESLRDVLRRGPLPFRKAVDLAAQVARGLAAAHAKGIVHRDVKPANIFITRDGRAKVLDFGLARVVHAADTDSQPTSVQDDPVTSPGAVLGTVGYMAPEQVHGTAADHRADVFALGAVCYEMLSGRKAFPGGSAIDVMAAIVRTDPEELSGSLVPPALDRVIRRCLEKNPEERFQSATDLAFALEALSGTIGGAGALGRLGSGPVPRKWRRKTIGAAALALGVLIGSTTAWWLVRRSAAVLPTYEAKTFDRRPVMNARFMPDGQTIVYSAATRGDAPELFVISPTAEAPQPLGVGAAHLLAVSRRGELAIIMNARHEQQRVYAGTFARMTLGSAPRAVRENVREADWAPDGDSLAIVQDLGDGRDRLEYPVGTTLHEVSGHLTDVRVSPDGARVAFVAHPWRSDDRGTVMVAERQRPARAVTGELWSVEGLAWTPDGTHVVFSGNATGGSFMEPMSVPADGSAAARRVLGVPVRLVVRDIGPDGRWLAVREDLAFGVRARVPGSDDERELSWLGSSGARSLSADGRHLLMVDVGQRSGADYGVVLRGTDGAQGVRLGSGDARALSPDGRWAAAILADPAEVVIYPTGAGEPIRLGRGHFGQIESVDWFPDNGRLLVCGAEPARVPRCYTVGLDDAVPTPLTPDGVTASIAPDGSTLLLTGTDGTRQVSSIGATTGRPVAALQRDDRVVAWSTDSTAVFVQRGFDVPATVERLDLATGLRRVVREIRPAGLDGLASILVADWVDEGGWYAYTYTMSPSTLFVVTGALP